ncbi:MAG: hypothetical protein DMG31_06900 [Acidobacteria bacterium]|nr:MAG: hypothetical protein DMG31_06900 [Acidobacteriota bacterium]
MAPANWFRGAALLALGAILGGLFVSSWEHPAAVAQQNNPPVTQATLLADVTRLRDITPPFSHPMVDVAMFAANLWFAGDKKNWPLANYYLGEMRNRLGWEVRLNPSPKGADGTLMDMKNIFDGIDTGSLTKLKTIIAMKDSKRFAAEYKNLLEDCYSCHKTAGRPYIRPMVPTAGSQPIVNLDPGATWPQ